MVEINLLPAQYRRQSAPSAWRYATYALVPLTVADLGELYTAHPDARLLAGGTALPTGVLTGAAGAPLMLWLLLRQGAVRAGARPA